jgi:hypothetical protein
MPTGKLAFAVTGAAFLASTLMPAQEWKRTEETDAFRGTHYVQFVLQGRFLTPPKAGSAQPPIIVAQCQPGKRLRVFNGRFLDGFVVTGAILSSQVIEKDTVFGGRSLPTVIGVQFRLDDGKIQSQEWNPSTDGTSAFFPEIALNTLLYGHFLPHKEGTGAPIRKVVLAINEAMGSEIVIQFDMPDPSVIAEDCGVITHKRSK